MRSIAIVQLDKRRPALILTRATKLPLLTWVTVAPITSTIRGLSSEVLVGPRNGLDHDSAVSCDNVTTVRKEAVGETIGLLFDDQEADLSRAISDAFDLEPFDLAHDPPITESRSGFPVFETQGDAPVVTDEIVSRYRDDLPD